MRKEDSDQMSLYTWFIVNYPQHRRKFQASLNGINFFPGGQITPTIRAMLKAIASRNINKMKKMGMCVGQSDIFLAMPRKGFHGMYLELKYGDGKESKDQISFGVDMDGEGYLYAVVWGLDAAKRQIRDYIEER